jgi:hypothetical protein
MLKLSSVFICCVLLFLSTFLHAAPEAKLWPYWQAQVVADSTRIDHRSWSDFLNKYLVKGRDGEPNRLCYAAVKSADREQLASYVSNLEQVIVTRLNRNEQKAFWINLYNALTVQLVLEYYPLASIRDIKSGWLSRGPWDLRLIKIEGFELSLNDIEHRILRPIWQDNRIHYAVNCASYSCPDLQAVAYTASNSDDLLEQAARTYINSDRGVRVDRDQLVLSQIFNWYLVDFAADEEQLIHYLQSYAAPALAQQLKTFSGSVAYEYHWDLNELK